jgi:hypothetical protein
VSRHRFTILMVTFLCVLLVYPIVEHFDLIGIDFLLTAFASLLLLSCILALSDNRRQAIVAALVIVPAIFLDWVDVFQTSRNFEIFVYLYRIGAYGFICYHILRYALRSGSVDIERIAAAVNVYLFLGLIWRDMYSLTNTLVHGAFNLEQLSQNDFLYYSFVTLSTLGYGDILPVTGPAKALAYIEAIVGQLYLTILVARLVGLHIAQTETAYRDRD